MDRGAGMAHNPPEGRGIDASGLVPRWAAYLLDSCSQVTARGYARHGVEFDDWRRLNAAQWPDLTAAHVQAWLDRQGGAPATRAQRCSALRSLARFAAAEGLADPRLADRLHPPAVVRLPVQEEVLDPFIASELRDGRWTTSERDRLIVLLLLDGGLRISELAALTVEAVDHGGRRLLVSGRWVPMSQRLLKSLPSSITSGESAHLIIGPHGRPLGTRSMFDVVRAAGSAVGDDAVTPHRLRYTRLQELSAAGVSESEIVEIMGYADSNKVRTALSQILPVVTRCYLCEGVHVPPEAEIACRACHGTGVLVAPQEAHVARYERWVFESRLASCITRVEAGLGGADVPAAAALRCKPALFSARSVLGALRHDWRTGPTAPYEPGAFTVLRLRASGTEVRSLAQTGARRGWLDGANAEELERVGAAWMREALQIEAALGGTMGSASTDGPRDAEDNLRATTVAAAP